MLNLADPSDRSLLLGEIKKAVSLQIEFWDSINRLEELINFECDPSLWVEIVATGVNTAEEVTTEDVDKFIPESKAIVEDHMKYQRLQYQTD